MVTQLIRKANKIQKVKSKIWTLSLKKLLTKLRVKLLNLLTKLRVRMLNPLTKLRVRMHNLLLMLKKKKNSRFGSKSKNNTTGKTEEV